MVKIMNLTVLTGNIATDIELREVGDTVVTSINLAVKDNFKKDTTHFIRVEAWGKTAELLTQYCAKGSKIGVEGSLKVDKFKDKEGNNREVTKVNASRIEFLDSKGSNSTSNGQQSNSYTNAYGGNKQASQAPDENPFANSKGPVDISDDSLPF